MGERSPSDRAALRRLGHAVEKRRIIAGFSQEKVSENSGISERLIRLLEAGSTNPSYLTLRAVARAVGSDAPTIMREAEAGDDGR